jgi:TM2 domain-containing membrane protein YozV
MGSLSGGDLVVGGLVVVLAVSLVMMLVAKRREENTFEIVKDAELLAMPEAEQESIQELYDKAVGDYKAIGQMAKKLQRVPSMQRRVNAMQAVSARLLGYLSKHPEKTLLARSFIETYQDRARSLISQYEELENTELSTAQVQETKRNIEQTIDGFREAYTTSFEHLLSDRLLDVNAEISVMKQTMEADGIKLKEMPAEDAAPAEDTAAPDSFTVPDGAPFRQPSCGRGYRFAKRHQNGPQQLAPMGVPKFLVNDVKHERWINAALAILLGAFGAHKFYQGRYGRGFLYFLLCSTGLSAILGVIEGIRYLCMPLDQFYQSIYLRYCH